VAFFVLLLLLADSTPPAASAIPLIGQHLSRICLLSVVYFFTSVNCVRHYYVTNVIVPPCPLFSPSVIVKRVVHVSFFLLAFKFWTCGLYYFYYYAVHIVCGKRHKTVECPSVRLSVPSIDNNNGGRGFAAEVGRSSSYLFSVCSFIISY